MSDSSEGAAAWWEHVDAGRQVPVGVVIVGCQLPATLELDDATARLRTQYIAGTEYIGREFRAAEPFEWHDNRIELVLGGGDAATLAPRALAAAEYLWQRLFVDLNLPARIAVHLGHAIREREPGMFSGAVFPVARSLFNETPLRTIRLSSDAGLLLPLRERGRLDVVRLSSADLAFAFPRAMLSGEGGAATPGAMELWDALLTYANSPEIRRLQYIGLRLQRKEPPSLDVRDVFVEPDVAVRMRMDGADSSSRNGSRPPVSGHDGTASGREPRRPRPGLEAPAQSFQSVLRTARHIVVLGDPGSGKSTLLRWLAATVVDGRFPALVPQIEPLLPLPVSVGCLAEILRTSHAPAPSRVLAAYYADRCVASESALTPFLEDCLSHGRCLLLFDGLDEVRPDEGADIDKWLEDFVAQLSENRIILTSRIIGYSGFRLGEGGVEAELRPFGAEQIERYLGAFHQAYLAWERGAPSSTDAEARTTKLLHALRAHPRLSSLATNPFMLSVLALVHRAEGRLPRHRIQAYQLLARALCETWDSARRLVLPDKSSVAIAYEEEAVPILGDLALAMHEKYPTGVAPEAFVLQALTSSLVGRCDLAEEDARQLAGDFLRLAAEQAPLLLERGPGRWGFVHLTFQEFFVAVGLHANEEFEERLSRHALEPRWEEVLRLGVSHMALVQNRALAASRLVLKLAEWKLPRGGSPVNDVLQKHVLLAASLAADLGNALPAAAQAKLVSKCSEQIARARTYEGIDSHRISLRDEASLIDNYVRHITGTDLAEPLARALADELGKRPSGGAHALMSALALLRVPLATEALLRDEDTAVRERAASALLELSRPENEDSPDPAVRRAAVRALSARKDEKAARDLLQCLTDESADVRAEAALALGDRRYSAALPSMLALLRDESEKARWFAAEAVAQLNDDRAIPPLLKLAPHEPAARAALWRMMERRGWQLQGAPKQRRRPRAQTKKRPAR